MNKKKITIISGIILLLFALIIIMSTLSPNQVSYSDDIFYKGDGIEMTEERLNKIINTMNNHEEVIIYYQILENIYDDKNNFIERKEYVSIGSKINLEDKTEETYNSFLLTDENGNEMTSQTALKNAKIDFKDTFKFDYKSCNGIYELVGQFAKTQNTDHNLFITSKLDTRYYDIFYNQYGQKLYVFKNEKILSEVEDIENIIGIKSLIILEEHNGEEYISTIENTITYKQGNTEIDKVFMINIVLQDTGENNNCSCAPNTDCNTGENNGVDCGEDSDC